ncbi:IS1096 element passenger TnpR family protein [Nonomuraea turcica]|uniref:IS1096 element passenger TnpR family protein n=1 Tax=Nonomuraea sp. G32 TaxID=3067274 RepID=UPI0035300A6C
MPLCAAVRGRQSRTESRQTGGRACPPEDSGGPEGFADLLRVLRHKKGWKYRQARNVLGTSCWDVAAWDRHEVNAQLAELGKQWTWYRPAARPRRRPGRAVGGRAREHCLVRHFAGLAPPQQHLGMATTRTRLGQWSGRPQGRSQGEGAAIMKLTTTTQVSVE